MRNICGGKRYLENPNSFKKIIKIKLFYEKWNKYQYNLHEKNTQILLASLYTNRYRMFLIVPLVGSNVM